MTKNHWIGCALALISAITFAFNLVLAGMSYQYGTNIHALNLTRSVLFFCVLFVLVCVQSSNIKIPLRAKIACLIVGLLLCAEMYVLLGAIQTIPVAVAVLIFYTYPLIIASLGWATRKDQFSFSALILLIVAFSGLIFVLFEGPATFNSSGILFAVIAAVVMAAMLITSEYNLNRYNNNVVLLYSLAVVAGIVSILSVTLVDVHWPNSVLGWWILTGSSVFYVIATFTLFKAVGFIGPLKTAIVDNTSPVWALLFGYLLLNQSLNFQQIIGVIVVIAAVMLLQIRESQASPPASD